MTTFQDMNGAKFDAAYMQHMVKGHQQAVQKLKSERGRAQSAPVEAVVCARHSPLVCGCTRYEDEGVPRLHLQ